jgi:hypothetical protein
VENTKKMKKYDLLMQNKKYRSRKKKKKSLYNSTNLRLLVYEREESERRIGKVLP